MSLKSAVAALTLGITPFVSATAKAETVPAFDIASLPGTQLAALDCSSSLSAACGDQLAQADPSVTPQPDAYGPQLRSTTEPQSDVDPSAYRSFGSQLGAVKWETAAIFGYYTAINAKKLFENPRAPKFHKEGWFGINTKNVGVDKVAHAYSAYVVSDLIYYRLKRKTGNAPGTPLTAAVIASAAMLYTELWDSIERTAGWSWEDVAFNSMGAGFSLLRNTVPGLDKKLDFRLMIIPNSGFIQVAGKRHFEQQRYYFALKASGFKAFQKGPLRFLELHAGYYGKDFTNEDRANGIRPKRRIFLGMGINLRELFFKDSDSRVGRAVGEALDYFQPPYTAVRWHITN